LRQLNGTFYGECSTAEDDMYKNAAISGFALVKGVVVYIKFINRNTVTPNALKLNISNSGNIAVMKYGSTPLDNSLKIYAGSVGQFIYDGTNWILLGL